MVQALIDAASQLQEATDPFGSMLLYTFNVVALTSLFYAAMRLCEQWYDEQVP